MSFYENKTKLLFRIAYFCFEEECLRVSFAWLVIIEPVQWQLMWSTHTISVALFHQYRTQTLKRPPSFFFIWRGKPAPVVSIDLVVSPLCRPLKLRMLSANTMQCFRTTFSAVTGVARDHRIPLPCWFSWTICDGRRLRQKVHFQKEKMGTAF